MKIIPTSTSPRRYFLVVANVLLVRSAGDLRKERVSYLRSTNANPLRSTKERKLVNGLARLYADD